MDNQTNLRYTFLREKYKNIGGDKKCKRYKSITDSFVTIFPFFTFAIWQSSLSKKTNNTYM